MKIKILSMLLVIFVFGSISGAAASQDIINVKQGDTFNITTLDTLWICEEIQSNGYEDFLTLISTYSYSYNMDGHYEIYNSYTFYAKEKGATNITTTISSRWNGNQKRYITVNIV